MHTEVTILNILIMKVFCFHYRPCNFYNLMNRIKKKWLFIWLNSKLQIWDKEIVHLFLLIAPYLHPQPLNKWNWKKNWMIVLANFGFSHNFTTLFTKWPQFDFWTEKIQIPDYRFPIEWNDIVLLFCFCWNQQQQKIKLLRPYLIWLLIKCVKNSSRWLDNATI